MLIGNNIRPPNKTTVEMYSPIDVFAESEKSYRDEELTDLFGAMEAFKQFILD